MNDEYKEVYLNDATVNHMTKLGYDDKQIIVELVRQRNAAIDKWQKLSMIAPKKIRTPNGHVLIYRCPDELIPEELTIPL